MTTINVLRRADIEVVVAGLGEGSVLGSRGITLETDTSLEEVRAEEFDLVALPGGLGGTEALMADERVLELVRARASEGRMTAAICAAPMVLAAAGVVEGAPLTSHPSVQGRLGGAAVDAVSRVVNAAPFLTSQGAGTAMEFALALVAELVGPEKSEELARGMVVAR